MQEEAEEAEEEEDDDDVSRWVRNEDRVVAADGSEVVEVDNGEVSALRAE